ncbi:phosphatase PAP2 family protein [Haliangium ochraceum]|uniref:Phosphoesterase PA-phosphatase related protein n=1 Tax=Haliangium ochraceum (strain DSM 14365 / JCM 11303 / SMP-2) TaxID=502025 RepID=D0LY20_HALO1|nr:phosphatase PAP2 family protein [Haliangium ochraceum]ACY14375.1 phosphoesterase PA-phosphatase related protein [Haliangium ochraceum DSM 14365]
MLRAPTSAEIWLALTAALLVLLALAFAYLSARRHSDALLARFRRWDERISATAPGPWQFLKRRFQRSVPFGLGLTLATAIFLVAVYLFAEVTDSWTEQGKLYHLDRLVNEQLGGAFSSGLVLQALRLATYFGAVPSMIVIAVLLALWLWRQRARSDLLALVLVSAGGQALLWSLKFLFARQRPGEWLTSAVGYSFPSGHSFTSMVLYGFLLYLVFQRSSRRLWRVLAAIALPALILSIGVSRVLLSVHWVSDVLGGYGIGLAWLVFSLAAAHVFEAARRARG